MSEQQVADGARPRARVGDVIAHGEPVPGNVVRMTDMVTDVWHRAARDPLWFTCMGGDPVSVAGLRETERWWPMTVVEVDPEPQPAEPGPLVLTLPEVPAGATLVGGKTGRRFEPYEDTAMWRGLELPGVVNGEAVLWSLGHVLDVEGSVTVELAPPPEPRTWPKLADEAASDLPDVVDVIGDGRWYRLTEPGAEHLYAQRGREGGWRLSLDGLRHLGEAREVLT